MQLVLDDGLLFPGAHIDVAHKERDLVLLIEGLPNRIGKGIDRGILNKDALGLAEEERQRIAIAQLSMQEMAAALDRLVILEEIALAGIRVAVEILEDRQVIGAILVEDARNCLLYTSPSPRDCS